MSVGDLTTAHQPPLLSGPIQRSPLLLPKSEHQASESSSPQHETRTAISRTDRTRTTLQPLGSRLDNRTSPQTLPIWSETDGPDRPAEPPREPNSVGSDESQGLEVGGQGEGGGGGGKGGVMLTMAAAAIQRRLARGGGGGADRRTPRRGDRDRMRHRRSLRRGEGETSEVGLPFLSVGKWSMRGWLMGPTFYSVI